ncbi:MAG: hypothetical protein E7048_04780 [Lentisphaerae bacterium]|nr:hypothetical protein [Lentisphaerota bacterium]
MMKDFLFRKMKSGNRILKSCLSALLMFSALTLLGSAPRGILNLEIKSTRPVRNFTADKEGKITVGEIPAKLKKGKKYTHQLTLRKDNLSGRWQKVELSFVPEKSEKVLLTLGVAFNGKRKSHPFLHADKAELQGAVLKNPGFENPDKKGIPASWQGRPKSSGTSGALAGKHYARINFTAPLTQEISVEKGKKVTFSLYVRQESPLADTRGADGMTNIYTDCDGTQVHISSGRLTLVPTFENCSYYINRTKAEWGKKYTAKVWYRAVGKKEWIVVLDPVDMEREKAWRGSIMLLKEDTAYEFKAVIKGEKTSELRRVFRTRSSRFKIGRTIVLDSSNFKGRLHKVVSGTPDGYTLYKAAPGFVLKGEKNLNGAVINCYDARYVIFDGLTIDANGSRHAIKLFNSQNIVIRNCDISNFGLYDGVRDMKQMGRWTFKGRVVNLDGGIYIEGGKDQLVERCYIHAPHSTANGWFYSHPAGPSAVCVAYVKGGTVIRYNDFIGSDKRRWNDAVESVGNGLINGGFGRDADIYGNIFAYGNDDGIELEGGEMNVRFYYNKVQGTLSGVSTGSCRLGPSYQFRNIYCKPGDENNYKGSSFKNGHGNQGDGAVFIINNSLYVPGGNGALNASHTEDPAVNPILKAFTRNNLFVTNSSFYIAPRWKAWNVDLDNDLFFGASAEVQKAHIAFVRSIGQEKNALYADPRYVDPDNGDLRLKKDSPARNRAANVPGLPVKHLGAFQDDGIDIPYRPIPVSLDKKEINFTHENQKKIFRFTLKAAGKDFAQPFQVRCNDSFFKVTPAKGILKSGQSITFSVSLNAKEIKAAKLHNGMALVRFADGYSKAVSVYADFRNDKQLIPANRKNLIPVKDVSFNKGVFKGRITIPQKGCYFLFVEGGNIDNMRGRAFAAFGKQKSGKEARLTVHNPGWGFLYTGSRTAWYFFLDKGSYPFTFTSAKPVKGTERFYLTAKPEEILR